MHYDVVIIGAGLGGLECGYILQKNGKKVCIVEKNALIGGCLQTFRRRGMSFDTGFHYVGGLEKGQMLHKLFSYFGLMDLPWVKMDNAFDEVFIEGRKYTFRNGFDNFQKTLTEAFPHEAENIAEYVSLLRKVGENTNNSFSPRDNDEFYSQSLFAQSAYEYLEKQFADPALRDVVSGTSLKLELNAEKLPLYIFAQLNSSFIQSAYRLQGGGMQIAETLRKHIEEMGGVVRRNAEVTGVVENDGKISAVVINNGTENIEADFFISDLHPATTMNILSDSKLIRNIYRKRICSLENTYGMFTANIALKPDKIKYLNRNIYAYEHGDLWHQDFTDGVSAILISMQPPFGGCEFTQNIDILTPMNWSKVERWIGTKIGNRGNEYDNLKKEMTQKCITLASKYIDGLADAIDEVYTSTPLTYSDYVGTAQGAAYGIRKDYNKLMFTVLTPRTPVPNLLLTGQNLNLHGILGVSMTSVFTCAEILGMQNITNDLNNY
ncbi:MAG: NAD(P)/FAD-dependent oxidoreductase [Bacteroidales bacterium]|nr:NAD(P)/FAD-dependent oxidoreductase [Bacteroidales bacterium]